MFRKRSIPVTILDLPGHAVDKALFDQSVLSEYTKHGMKKSPLSIIRSAAVHYKGRHRHRPTRRFLSAFDEIYGSFEKYNGGQLCLNDDESNELQQRSSEVIAVGLCIAFTSEIFNINRKYINPIEGTGKRCDFKFSKYSFEYVVESKGRKGNITGAIQDVFKKKAHHASTAPKYGVISSLPRNGDAVSITIVDPAYEPRAVPRNERIIGVLTHYAKLSYMSGFWRLGDLLFRRVDQISRGRSLDELDGKSLEYENILKLGLSIEISTAEISSQAFYQSGDGHGWRIQLGENTAIFALDSSLIELLESQDFTAIEEYSAAPIDIALNDGFLSRGDDGCSLFVGPNLR